VAVLAGNGSLYGGPFRFFRNANNHDSKLDVIIFKEAGYRLVLDSLRGLALGGMDSVASTSYFQTEEFVVKADREVPVEVDGEWVGRFSEVRFVESAHRLRVIAPEEPLIIGLADSLKSLLPWPRRVVELEPARRS
jgi:diacylglycerol kinase family enzyme